VRNDLTKRLGNQPFRERGQRRRPRAGEDQKLAGFARASFFFVLQISEQTSSLKDAFTARHLRGGAHRWMRAGASSAVTPGKPQGELGRGRMKNAQMNATSAAKSADRSTIETGAPFERRSSTLLRECRRSVAFRRKASRVGPLGRSFHEGARRPVLVRVNIAPGRLKQRGTNHPNDRDVRGKPLIRASRSKPSPNP